MPFLKVGVRGERSLLRFFLQNNLYGCGLGFLTFIIPILSKLHWPAQDPHGLSLARD